MKLFHQSRQTKHNDCYFFNIFLNASHFFTFRKSAYDKTVGINPKLTSAVDQDLYLKLYETGHFKFVRKPLYHYRIHEKGVSQDKNQKNKLIIPYSWDNVYDFNEGLAPVEKQEKQGYIDEINYQKKMIHNLIKWLRNLFFLSSLGVLLMYYFSNILFVKIFAIILIIISILAIILVGKAIYSGKKNINKIVDQFSLKYKNSL